MSKLCTICNMNYFDPAMEPCCFYCRPMYNNPELLLKESEKRSLLLWKVDHNEQQIADRWGMTVEEINRLAFIRFCIANGTIGQGDMEAAR